MTEVSEVDYKAPWFNVNIAGYRIFVSLDDLTRQEKTCIFHQELSFDVAITFKPEYCYLFQT